MTTYAPKANGHFQFTTVAVAMAYTVMAHIVMAFIVMAPVKVRGGVPPEGGERDQGRQVPLRDRGAAGQGQGR